MITKIKWVKQHPIITCSTIMVFVFLIEQFYPDFYERFNLIMVAFYSALIITTLLLTGYTGNKKPKQK